VPGQNLAPGVRCQQRAPADRRCRRRILDARAGWCVLADGCSPYRPRCFSTRPAPSLCIVDGSSRLQHLAEITANLAERGTLAPRVNSSPSAVTHA